MENEKFQELVLEHLANLNQEITEIKQNGVAANQRFDMVDQRLDRVDQRLDSFDQRLDSVDQRLDSVDQRLDRAEASLIRIENDHGDKLKALFDAGEVMMDRTERLMESQTRMEVKIDRLSIRMSANEAELRKAK